MKHLVKKESAHHSLSNQIVHVSELMLYCRNSISRIYFSEISSAFLEATRALMSKQFQLGTTIPKTTSFHHFIPLATNQIGCRFISSSSRFILQHTLLKCQMQLKGNQ